MRDIRSDILIRAVADVVIVNCSLALGLLLRFFVPVHDGTPPAASINLESTVVDSVRLFVRTAPLLTAMTLALFVVAGVYTRARFFQVGYKLPRLIQVVTVAYALCGLMAFLLGPILPMPRVTLLAAWFFTLVFMIGSRFWLAAWSAIALREAPAERSVSRPVQHVLVIGGAGYIGSWLCRLLLERGYRVRVLDALLYGDESLRGLVGRPRFELQEGDSRDIGRLVRAIAGVDAVVHLGEIVGDPACALDEQVTLEINLAATRMAAEVANGFGVLRFVYASSCSVYGATPGVVDERSKLNPVSLYARTKITAEQALLDLRGKGLHPVIVRLATVYGLSPRPRFDLVVNTLAARACVDRDITVYGGSQWRPFVHVRDVARALLLCLEKPLPVVDGQIFNVGSDTQNYTISQVADLVVSEVPTAHVRRFDQDVDQRDYQVSFAKIRRELGFEPSMTVRDGIREIVEALRSGRVATYRDPRHHNAQFLLTDYGRHRVRAYQAMRLYQSEPVAVDEVLVSSGR